MTTELGVTLHVDLADSEQAWEFAQFIKRVCFETLYEHTEAHLTRSERERRAYLMIGGLVQVEKALAARMGASMRYAASPSDQMGGAMEARDPVARCALRTQDAKVHR
jgi:hypothetical protein